MLVEADAAGRHARGKEQLLGGLVLGGSRVVVNVGREGGVAARALYTTCDGVNREIASRIPPRGEGQQTRLPGAEGVATALSQPRPKTRAGLAGADAAGVEASPHTVIGFAKIHGATASTGIVGSRRAQKGNAMRRKYASHGLIGGSLYVSLMFSEGETLPFIAEDEGFSLRQLEPEI